MEKAPMSDLPPITILLAVYNGARYLQAQLESIAKQQFDNWRLIISDDGSQDDSHAICQAFQAKIGPARVNMIKGPAAGPTRNFLHLIAAAPDGHPLAFCDQDDIWLPHKLDRAAVALVEQNGPLLYCSRTFLCDENLQNRRESVLFQRPHTFRNALVQACTPGNTSMVNTAGSALLKRSVAAAVRHRVPSHDWWTYQLIAGSGGKVIFDAEPTLLYRQHGNNVMGRNDTVIQKYRRLAMLFQGEYGGWLISNQAALNEVSDLLTPENRQLLGRFEQMLRAPGPIALRTMRQTNLYRQSRSGDLALRAAAFLGRLRQPG